MKCTYCQVLFIMEVRFPYSLYKKYSLRVLCIPKNSKRYKNEKWKDVQFLAGFVAQIISSGSETVLNEMYTTIHC